MYKRIFYLLILILAFTSCKNDIDLNADYKDIIVVYGILDQDTNTQFLKINKAFLVDGNAINYTKIQDSVFTNNLDVKIFETQENGTILEHVFDTVTIFNKDDGTFYSPKQIVFKSDFTVYINNKYNLEVINKKTGDTIRSEAKSIGNFYLTNPNIGSTGYNINNSSTNAQFIEFTNPINAKRYNVKIDFIYKEITFNYDTTYHKIFFQIPNIYGSTTDGTGRTSGSYFGKEFYNKCLSDIMYSNTEKESTIYKRVPYRIDITVTAVDENLSMYIDAIQSAGSSIIETPLFTNIENGYGVLSCRKSMTHSFAVHQNVTFELTTQEEFLNLKFQRD